eukprot:c24202_g1_i3 orf=1295-3016(+)
MSETVESVRAAKNHLLDKDNDAASTPVATNKFWTSMLLNSSESQASPSSSAIPVSETLNWSLDNPITAANADLSTDVSNLIDISTCSAMMSRDSYDKKQSTPCGRVDSLSMQLPGFGNIKDHSVCSQILVENARKDVLENAEYSSAASAQDLELPRALHQSGDLLMLEHVKPLDDNCSWDLPLFQGDEIRLAVEKVTGISKTEFPHDRLNYGTSTLSDIDMWSHDPDSATPRLSMNVFASEIDTPPPIERLRHIKYVHPTTYTWNPLGDNKSPLWLCSSVADRFKGDNISSHLPNFNNNPILKSLSANAKFEAALVDDEFPRRWLLQSDICPSCSSQSLVCCQASERPPQILEYGNSPQHFDLHSLQRDIKPLLMHTTADFTSSLHYVQQSIKAKPFHDATSSNPLGIKWNREEYAEKTLDSKRNIGSISSCDSSSEGMFKRPKIESTTPTIAVKARKEKLGDRITVLQQLVSPFGKTDTASVLHETIGYIKFLQDQVQVLSTPYVNATDTTAWKNEPGSKQWIRDKDQHFPDRHKQDLKSRGLCLVPVSCTLQVLNDNGADYWASPSRGGCR